MAPYTFSNLSETLDTTLASSSQKSGKQGDHGEQASAPRLSRKRDLWLAFVIVSLPLLVIAILLLAFTFHDREIPPLYPEDHRLPFSRPPSLHPFYTNVASGSFLLVASWASNIAGFVIAPFMVLFSYAVAREIILHPTGDYEYAQSHPPLLREIMRGAHVGVWHWVAQKTYQRPKRAVGKELILRVVDVAGIGLFTATLLTILVIVGDNWLHVATHRVVITHYNDMTNYTENFQYGDPTLDVNTYQAGFKPLDLCDEQLVATLPQNVSAAPLPCSLNRTDDLTNVANPESVYLTLGTGISQISDSFNGINFTQLRNEEEKNTATPYQVVTYQPPNENVAHSLFFYPDAAAEYSDYGYEWTNFGIDYVANSTSMVTECTFATQECDIRADATNSSGSNNISIPFHCYPDFSGNLGQTPTTGHERAQGWNMSFYQLVNGTPTNIPVQAQSNPFHFYIATAVNSISYSDIPDDNPDKVSFKDAGEGFTAFALNCEATIYDVTFSIVNGSFKQFNHSISTPQKANIMQAPLQVGFGQYHLYQAASLAVLVLNDSLTTTMGKAFSQTGMALASGVFDFDYNILQRFRWNKSVTMVPKAPLTYLVVVCLVYSVFGMVMTFLALHLRRRPDVRDQQARLMVEWAPEMDKLDQAAE